MRILGISEFDNDAAAALLVDGKIIGAVSEERFSRIKQHAGFPHRAINWLLGYSGLELDDIDIIAIGKQPAKTEVSRYANAIKSFPWFSYTAPLGRKILDLGIWFGRNLPRYYLYVKKQERDFLEWLKKNSVGLKKVRYAVHHEAHAATAYYFSGWDEGLVITCDGQGLGETATVWIGKDGKLKKIHSVKLPNSMGNFYGAITKAIGFRPNRHEGKITGLAAYAQPADEADRLCRDIAFFKDGTIHAPYIYGALPEMKALISKIGREAVAASFQKRLEEVMVEYVGHYLKKYPCRNVALAGGVFANVKLNQRIAELENIDEVFVFPAMSDAGLAVGAAILQEESLMPQRLDNVYFGPEYGEMDVRKELERNNLEYEKPKNLASTVAEKLADGRVVALFNGRMEYGPRALGNRTVMYETIDPKVNDWLNKSLARSEFMPFAPVTLAEHAEECYISIEKGGYTAKFMTMTFDCTDYMKKTSPAVVHVDGTARPQIIDRETNGVYYDILKKYEAISGIPSVVNTSFNMHEEPIVCSPYDALRAYRLGNLDYLAIGPFLLENTNGVTRKREKR